MAYQKTLVICMMRVWMILLCILLVSPLVSQQYFFTIEEYHDAANSALNDVHSVLVVNNALVQPADFGHTIMVDGEQRGSASVNLDKSLLYGMFSVAETLDRSSEFVRVELLDKSQNHFDNYYSRSTLGNSQANQLLVDYDVDALLVLNQLVIYDVLDNFLTTGGGYYAFLQAYIQSHWTVYYAESSRTSVSFTTADTLVWESKEESTRERALAYLPNRQEALLYLSSVLGEHVAQSLLPYWQSTRRYLYEQDDVHIKAGLEHFRYQHWQEAINSWTTALDGKNKKAAAVAAANIAIAYEMLGDEVSAYAYAEKACRFFGAWKSAYGRQQQANIRYYQAQLQEKMAR